MEVPHIPQIVNFQITPYSDNVASYINSLSEDQIYRLFNSDQVTSEILTAALFAIYKFESNARISILKKSTNFSQKVGEAELRCPGSTKNLKYTTLVSLANVQLMDNILFSDNFNNLRIYPNVFILIIDGIYAGHIYAWTVNNPSGIGKVINIVGIRTSIYQLLIDICGLRQRGVSSIFFDAIRRWTLSNIIDEPSYIRVLQPIEQMPALLTKCGFVQAKNVRSQQGMDWMFNNSSLGDIPMVRMLILREFDYIIPLTNSFNCTVPTYSYKELI